jgi:beta-lactamase regulating signal transducer with metallopeptidase domain
MTADLLVTWLAQSTALAAGAALAVRSPGCRSNAAARSAVWSVTIAVCAALPGWPLVLTYFSRAAETPAPAMSGGAVAPLVLPVASGIVAAWLTWLWMAGAAFAVSVIGLDVVRIMRLKRRAVPLSDAERLQLGRLADEVAGCRGTRVCWSDDLDAPAALGFGRPVVALPRDQVRHLSEEQLRHVVLHELAHVRRRDDWRTLAEHLLAAAAWINPAVQLACRQAAVAREMACDEWVVRQTASPAAYARCLADVAVLRSRGRRIGLVSAVTGRPGMLRRRVAAVLAFDYHRHAHTIGLLAWVAPVVLCAAGVAMLQLPTMFVVAGRQANAQVVVATPAAAQPLAVALPGPTPSAGRPRLMSQARRAAAAGPAIVPPPTSEAPAEVEGNSGGAYDALPALEAAPATARAPLAAVPVPDAGAAGVGAVEAPAGTSPSTPDSGGGWWSGPLELGGKTGAAAATAGRATASLFTRVGSSVPKLFAQ